MCEDTRRELREVRGQRRLFDTCRILHTGAVLPIADSPLRLRVVTHQRYRFVTLVVGGAHILQQASRLVAQVEDLEIRLNVIRWRRN